MAKNNPSLDLDENEENTEESGHELFLQEDEAKPLKPIHYIHVSRFEGSQKYNHPRLIPADEMPDAESLFRRFGGGRYELIARDASKKRIITRRAFVLPGRSKPLDSFEEDAEADEENKPVAQVTPQQAANMSNGGALNLLASLAPALAVVAPIILQWMQNSQAQSLKQTEAQALMFKTILEQSKDSSREFITSMQQMYGAQIQMLTTAKQQGEGTVDPSGFMSGVEFMQNFTEAQREALAEKVSSADTSDPMKMIGDIMGMIQMFKAVPGLADGNPIGSGGSGGETPPAT